MNLKELVPNWYEDIREFDVLFAVEEAMIQEIDEKVKKVKDNQWIQTADEQTIYFHEELLGILANPEVEDLAFRKQRILNRLQSKPPFTVTYLKEQLNKVFGKDNYLLVINYDDYQIILETATENANWFIEAQSLINKVKPANIVYIQRPTYHEKIEILESGTTSPLVYFRIGKSRIGRDSLLRRGEEGKVIFH
ncbi:putative phage tail protein [Enterococcus sp.]|mgnify:CR=1 FL=1|uniref:putative phage tail protein n=1 Tax=Enterococcus sp. TaxID=35783 RepID=UPI0025C12CE5|nr:putative phage tail protein [Enterococcus sp.]